MDGIRIITRLKELHVFDPDKEKITFIEFANLVLGLRGASGQSLEEMAEFYLDVWVKMANEQGFDYSISAEEKPELVHGLLILLKRLENLYSDSKRSNH